MADGFQVPERLYRQWEQEAERTGKTIAEIASGEIEGADALARRLELSHRQSEQIAKDTKRRRIR